MLFLPHSKVQALVTTVTSAKDMVCDVTMATQQCYINNPNPLFSKAHFTDLNLNYCKMIEAMGLKIIAPAYQIS
jgi:hypothetical protein